jgi:mortality factor 4-like protein 1
LQGDLRRQALTHHLLLQEADFQTRPSIKLIIPDHIKAILVDDWENVTKNQQLVPLPSAYPVNAILNDYLEFEKPKRQPGSAQADILEEVIAGLKEYFEKCLGRILLYR